MKIIRQPYIVDRLQLTEINKDGQLVGLAVIYLNEFRVVSAAFILHSQEPKILKVWREQITKAKEVYEEAKSASHHRSYDLTGQYSADGDDEMAACPSTELQTANQHQSGPAAGRRGSFRGSRISSIGHSHSGSMDLMETGSLPSGFR